MTMNTSPLDPTIATLADQAGPAVDPIPWQAMHACTGITREHYFAALATGLIMAGERLIAGYVAREDRARGARHLAYSEGVVRAPRKMTRAQEQMADARAFGLHGKAAA
jgi:hypothetical protein